MNCSQIAPLLSPYYDGELDSERRRQVRAHLQRCPTCAEALTQLELLSSAAQSLPEHEAPEGLWETLANQLVAAGNSTVSPAAHQRSRGAPRPERLRWQWVAIVATLLFALVGGSFLYRSYSLDRQSQVAADFRHFLQTFQQDPQAAQKYLLSRYEGHPIDPTDAATRIGYPSVLARGVPDGYQIDSTYVVHMPCCRCLQALCRRTDGSTVAIMEHDHNEGSWFADRPVRPAVCGGKQCQIADLGGQIAATWNQNGHYVTLVGVKDEQEVDHWVRWVSEQAQAENPS